MRSAWRPSTGYQATQDDENSILSAICSNIELQGEQQVPAVALNAWSVVSGVTVCHCYCLTALLCVSCLVYHSCNPLLIWMQADQQNGMSGCDSGTCTYCHSMKALRNGRDLGDARDVCWLRRKLSETELVSYSSNQKDGLNSRSNEVPDVNRLESKPESIWQHALLEPEHASRLLLHRKNRTYNPVPNTLSACGTGENGRSKMNLVPWTWKDEYLAEPVPPKNGGTLTPVSTFRSPSNHHRGGQSISCQQADIVCGMEFESHGWLLATAGVSKQVCLYSLAGSLNEEQESAPIRVHRLASKLSSLTWYPDEPGVVTVGDYDGVVVQLDLESGHVVAEGDEHSGHRVWSASHSQLRPHLVASGSDDGSVIFWGGRFLGDVVGRLMTSSEGRGRSPVTAVQFSPFDEFGFAVACADSRAYVYDLRRTSSPVSILQGHSRPVSYVKYLSRNTVVTASTDATLKTWSLPFTESEVNHSWGQSRLNKTYSGHPNSKNFVGLSVQPEAGLVACGSETSSVYAYSLAWELPLASYPLPKNCQDGQDGQDGGLCSAVAWQPSGCLPPGTSPLLAAAYSDGHVRVLSLDLLE